MSVIYYSWVEGSLRKTRSVNIVDKKDAMAEFLQTFVLPLIASISFLALIIILAKHFGDKLGKVKGAMKFIENPFEAAGEVSELVSKGVEVAGKVADGDISVDIGGDDGEGGDSGDDENEEEDEEEDDDKDSEEKKLEEEKSKLESIIARLKMKLERLLAQGSGKGAKKKRKAQAKGDESDSDSDSGSESGGGGLAVKLEEKKIQDLRVKIDEKMAKLAKVFQRLERPKSKKSKKQEAKQKGKKGAIAPVPVAAPESKAGTLSPAGGARDPFVWKFTAWQVIWLRLIPPLLTWATFCTVTAAGAGKVSALTSSYTDSLGLVACLVAQNSTTPTKLTMSSSDFLDSAQVSKFKGGWWENPYGSCATGANATLLYASAAAPEGRQLCAWPQLAFMSDALKSSVTYGTWAYSTPIITCILTIFVLSGAFILHDANKKSPTGGTVARKWTDTQMIVRWKRREQLKMTGGSKGNPFYWLFESVDSIDMYAAERTDMDRSMILYLPVELQNHIRKTEKLILDHFSDFSIKDEGSASRTKEPPAEMADRVKTRLYCALEKMCEELGEAKAFYEENQPPPPPEPVPVQGQEQQNKKAQAAHKALLRRYNGQKQGIAKALEMFAQLKDDLDKVQEALRGRKLALEEAKKGEAARVDSKLMAGLDVIVGEFSEFLAQIVNPDRNKGRNLFLSLGPQTLLRGGIPGSPTEIPTQSLSLLLATITFANNYFCDSLVTDVTGVYSPDTPFQPGCPDGLVSWAQSSLTSLAVFKKTSGLAAVAVFLGLVNSVVTITTLMGKQTGELVKRINARGQDLINAAESNEPPPILCIDTCLPGRAAARRSLHASVADEEAPSPPIMITSLSSPPSLMSEVDDETPKPTKTKKKKKKGAGVKAKQRQQSDSDSDSDGDSISNFDSISDGDSGRGPGAPRHEGDAASSCSNSSNRSNSSNSNSDDNNSTTSPASALTLPVLSLDLFNAPANTVSFVSSLVCGVGQPRKDQSKWYYVSSASNERRGPVALDDLYSLLVKEEIGPTTSVWRKGMGNWMPLEACPVYEGLVGRKTWAEASSFDLEQPHSPPVPPSPSPAPSALAKKPRSNSKGPTKAKASIRA
jgi:hypothetical protein